MLRVIALIAGFLIAGPVLSADLGKPAAAPAAVAPAPVPDQWNGMYVEFGAVGQFMNGEKNAAGLAGIGYNYHAFGNPWVVGAFLRYGFSAEGNSDAAVLTFDQPLTAAIRAGYLVAPSTLLYGLAGYSKSLKDDFKGPILVSAPKPRCSARFASAWNTPRNSTRRSRPTATSCMKWAFSPGCHSDGRARLNPRSGHHRHGDLRALRPR